MTHFFDELDDILLTTGGIARYYAFSKMFDYKSSQEITHYVDELEKRMKDFCLKNMTYEKPKVFHTLNPNDLTGYLYDANFLLEPVEEFTGRLFIIDEAYIHFAFDQRETMDKLLV